jgi:pimeloyl-ACP methyl ester carboxylesterase
VRRAVAITLLAALAAAPALRAQAPGQSAPREEAESLVTPTGTIYGTLRLPDGSGPWPVALVIAGSGPTDRNGNTPLIRGRNDALLLVAQALAAHGIASLRYDKRGIAASARAMRAEADLRFDDYVNDAAGWLRRLRADPRFTTLTVVGHSEGSLVGMLAATTAGADGFVSLDGAGRPAAAILHEQLARQLPPDRLAQADSIFARLSAGETVDSVPAKLWLLVRPSVQPYLISWFRHDPARDLAAFPGPALVVQGTTDLQVDTADAARLASADPRARLALVDGMNHVLKLAPADPARQAAAYSDPSLPLAPDLVRAVTGFILGLRATR